MRPTLLFLLVSACSPTVGRVDRSPPISCKTHSIESHGRRSKLSLDRIIEEECSNGHVLLDFQIKDGQFSGDRIQLTCTSSSEHATTECPIMVNPGIHYTLLLGNEDKATHVDLLNPNDGIPGCTGETYRLFVWKTKKGLSAQCMINGDVNFDFYLGDFVLLSPGDLAIHFRY